MSRCYLCSTRSIRFPYKDRFHVSVYDTKSLKLMRYVRLVRFSLKNRKLMQRTGIYLVKGKKIKTMPLQFIAANAQARPFSSFQQYHYGAIWLDKCKRKR
jgi:hypothetical protein